VSRFPRIGGRGRNSSLSQVLLIEKMTVLLSTPLMCICSQLLRKSMILMDNPISPVSKFFFISLTFQVNPLCSCLRGSCPDIRTAPNIFFRLETGRRTMNHVMDGLPGDITIFSPVHRIIMVIDHADSFLMPAVDFGDVDAEILNPLHTCRRLTFFYHIRIGSAQIFLY